MLLKSQRPVISQAWPLSTKKLLVVVHSASLTAGFSAGLSPGRILAVSPAIDSWKCQNRGAQHLPALLDHRLVTLRGGRRKRDAWLEHLLTTSHNFRVPPLESMKRAPSCSRLLA
jgi:hypothetical protein